MSNGSCGDLGALCPRYEYLALLVLPLAAIFGNFLVVVAVATNKPLRTTTNFLIVSLAAADLLVGLTVMPFSVYVQVSCHFYPHPFPCFRAYTGYRIPLE